MSTGLPRFKVEFLLIILVCLGELGQARLQRHGREASSARPSLDMERLSLLPTPLLACEPWDILDAQTEHSPNLYLLSWHNY